MFTLVIGSAASGKSEYAEQQMLLLPGKRIYIATMRPWDTECLARIEKHRIARIGRSFETVECYTGLSSLELEPGSNVLLECMSNLVANEMYDPDRFGTETIVPGIRSLLRQCAHLTVVTNEVFSGGTSYSDETLAYLRILAEINRELAAIADRVVEVVCGLPNTLKDFSL